ncbi:VOC family protein [Microbacterium luticocti]|uniref:VOC family protein n=1 Tax=Microbacterium luticocti TaxID=451764 RepID=UPI00041678F2|nr:VOC family protein [Microbacterium luticocti]
MRCLHHIGITVGDMDEALRFYRTVSGGVVEGPYVKSGPAVEAATGHPGAQILQAFVALSAGAAVIELLEYRGTGAPRIDPNNASIGAAHPAVVVDDMDAALAEVRELGYETLSEPMTGTTGPLEDWRYVYVLGPDGVRVELVQPPAAEASAH